MSSLIVFEPYAPSSSSYVKTSHWDLTWKQSDLTLFRKFGYKESSILAKMILLQVYLPLKLCDIIPLSTHLNNLQCPCHFLPPRTRGTKWTEGKTEPRLFSDLAEASLAPKKWSLALFAPFRVPHNLSKLRFKKFGSFRTPQVGPFRSGIRFISHPKFQGG